MPVEEEESPNIITQKLDGLIFKTNSEQRMSSGLLVDDDDNDDNDVILIGRGDEPCYTPEIVRIGLNHGYDRWCETMYEDKCRCLKLLLNRRNETSVDRYVRAMEDLVERARECYVQPGAALRGESVEMMLLDSCFIVVLFHMSRIEGIMLREEMKEPLYHKMCTDQYFLPTLRRDLFRVGNELPFSVLLKFLEISLGITHSPYDLISWALNFFKDTMGSYDLFPENLFRRPQSPLEIQSLLGLVYYTFVEPRSLNRGTHLMLESMKLEFMKLEFINYATELQEAGVKFKKIKSSGKLFDIKFKKNGVLEISPLRVSNNTLYDLRNLMEFEKQLPLFVPTPINDYVKFIQCLVNSPNDVKILRHYGIIDNWLGNDEVIFNRLNELSRKVEIRSFGFTYSELMKKVNEHCRHRPNVWMANLRRNYFNSPWAFLSLLAAVVLLLLTTTQTVFSILSYHPN